MSTPPPCAGKWWLFDSVHQADHAQAAKLCADCPMRLQCADLLETTRREQPIAGAANGPQGTWAGLLVNPKRGGS